jgi:hypothetical protein
MIDTTMSIIFTGNFLKIKEQMISREIIDLIIAKKNI